MPIASRKEQSIKSGFNSLDLSSQCTGTNQVFSTKPFQRTSLVVFYNGIAQRIGSEITILSNSQFQTSFVPEATDKLFILFFSI